MPTKKHLRLSMLLVLLLAACEKVGPVAVRPTTKPKASTPSPSARPSGKPSGAPQLLGASETLLKPAGNVSIELKGQIALDLAYATGTGKAEFISDQGGGVIQVAGSPIISDQGGNLVNRDLSALISHDTAGLTSKVKFISDQGGGFISDQGGGLLSDYGAGLIANNGGGLIANNGGGLIANNGGGLIANNGGGLTSKTKFGLLDLGRAFGLAAAETEHRPVPVSGMLVGLLSLRSGALLPIGVDATGKAVYTIYTDAKGQFALNVPADLKDNVLVVSSFPGTTDRGLAVDLVTRLDGAQTTRMVDDSTTVLTAYIRQAILARLEEITVPNPCSYEEAPGETLSRIAFETAVSLSGDGLKSPEFVALPRASRLRVLTRYADALMSAFGDLESAEIAPKLAERERVSGSAMNALRSVLAEVEGAAAKKLQANPRFFDDRPYVKLAQRLRPLEVYPPIRKPADLSEFIVRAFLASSGKGTSYWMDQILVELGLDTLLMPDFQAAAGSLMLRVGSVLGEPETVERVKAAVEIAIKDEQEAKRAADAVCPPEVQAPAVDVVASSWGLGDGTADGPVASAQFHEPARLLVDPAGYLVVSEGHRIRKIDLKAPDHPVTTVAGTGEAGLADGPGATARFSRPLGLALDPAGNLYVADGANNAIRKIAGYAGAAPVVSTLAGGGLQGLVDGAGPTARFSTPTDLSLGQDGSFYVVDFGNRRLRRMTMAGAVTAFVGSDLAAAEFGMGDTAVFSRPRGLALLPDGRMAVVDNSEDLIRVVGPEGSAGQLAGNRHRLNDAQGVEVTFRDGTFWTARYHNPDAIALAPDGSLIIADLGNHRIRRMDPDGWVTTLAGGGAEPLITKRGGWIGGFADGPAATSRLNAPSGVAVGPDGTVYVADTGNHRIRVIKRP